MNFNYKLGVIGYGNMASAICKGIISSGVCDISDIFIFDINMQKITEAKSQGFSCSDGVKDIALQCKYILLSIKPQNAGSVFAELSPQINDNIIISIMAGYLKQNISKGLNTNKICRCMPNTPALVSKGITAIDSSSLSVEEKNFVFDIFNSVGGAIEVEEKYMNAVTAVSGSGPAYVYLFIKHYINAAKSLGLNQNQSERLVLSTLCGAAEMVKQGGKSIDNLIENVCSKGGTTIEGVNVLNNNGFEQIIKDCVKAAFNRAEELSKNQ